MNGLLQLKGRFEKRGNEGMGPVTLPAHKKVTSEHIEELIVQLSKVKAYWSDKDDIAGMIVSVHYIRVVAKSNRLKILLADVGKKPVDSIRGAKFVTGKIIRARQYISMYLHIMYRHQPLIKQLIICKL